MITLPWHSTLATDRPLYHDDTRCPEGGAIKLKDRRSGDGGRDPCAHCAGLLIEALKGGLLKPTDTLTMMDQSPLGFC